MSATQFWNSDPWEFQAYIDAHALRQEETDKNNWLMGIYMKEAIASCFNEKAKYPEKPMMKGYYEDSRLTDEERDERDTKAEITKMLAYAKMLEATGMKKAFDHIEEGEKNESV